MSDVRKAGGKGSVCHSQSQNQAIGSLAPSYLIWNDQSETINRKSTIEMTERSETENPQSK